ncbi:hypothetical protein BKA82DRAFT_245468 [Pisolithus tinctorius]|uniref:G domain-containing protein n=1 Tax=Pisolithus tinctorius Marx 270 TaxID=870435 RepID=A0A0C3NLI6_PISTI|nr:hypothetical protein BKA82DRAFT_245468 [Pisolithus tinctorius]KIN96485.1 hypothetical protein M404DRAFT_245468 [Pisolithus tinctorius Marx 270]
MAPGRVKKFLAYLPSARATDSRRSHKSHGDPVTAETETTEASNPTSNMTSSVPVAVATDAAAAEAAASADLNAAAGNLTGEMTDLGAMISMTTINWRMWMSLMFGIETTASRAPFHLDPKMAKEYMKDIERFRVLVIGRGNAGKTTILQRVCNTVDKPDIFDGKGNKIDNVVVQGTLGRGYHNIEDELVFKSNPGFVFHDSPGFEAGSAEQFEEMKKFVLDHAVAWTLNKRIHAIWYCIPMTDYHRTVTAAEQKFFNECDTAHVPVVVLLTKVDALNFAAIEELLDEGLEMEEAEEKARERESLLLEKWQTHIKQILDQCKFPPKLYLPLEEMHNESADCTTLIQCTASVLNEEGLQRLLISTQQSSIGLCIDYAVTWVVRRMIRSVIEEGERYDIRAFESAMLSWFPKHYVRSMVFYDRVICTL